MAALMLKLPEPLIEVTLCCEFPMFYRSLRHKLPRGLGASAWRKGNDNRVFASVLKLRRSNIRGFNAWLTC